MTTDHLRLAWRSRFGTLIGRAMVGSRCVRVAGSRLRGRPLLRETAIAEIVAARAARRIVARRKLAGAIATCICIRARITASAIAREIATATTAAAATAPATRATVVAIKALAARRDISVRSFAAIMRG